MVSARRSKVSLVHVTPTPQPSSSLSMGQAENRVKHTSLNVSDPKLWKPMDSSRLLSPGVRH